MVNDISGLREVYGDAYILKAAEAVLFDKYMRGATISNPKDMASFFISKLCLKEREHFIMVLFDAKNRVITHKTLFKGTVGQVGVHPREIVKLALNHNASGAALCHNHPSGVVSVSEADKTITKKVKQALDLIEVQLLDHIVVAGNESLSMAEYGYV